MQHAQDSLNPRVPGHANIMILSPKNEEENDDPHPYWYAWIIGIFHANVQHIGPNSKSQDLVQMDFLFSWWFGCDLNPQPGWKTRCLICLGFIPGKNGSAFGFLDPNQVIHAIHLIPAFHWGCVTTKYLPQSPIACGIDNSDHDWSYIISECLSFYYFI